MPREMPPRRSQMPRVISDAGGEIADAAGDQLSPRKAVGDWVTRATPWFQKRCKKSIARTDLQLL